MKIPLPTYLAAARLFNFIAQPDRAEFTVCVSGGGELLTNSSEIRLTHDYQVTFRTLVCFVDGCARIEDWQE